MRCRQLCLEDVPLRGQRREDPGEEVVHVGRSGLEKRERERERTWVRWRVGSAQAEAKVGDGKGVVERGKSE